MYWFLTHMRETGTGLWGLIDAWYVNASTIGLTWDLTIAAIALTRLGPGRGDLAPRLVASGRDPRDLLHRRQLRLAAVSVPEVTVAGMTSVSLLALAIAALAAPLAAQELVPSLPLAPNVEALPRLEGDTAIAGQINATLQMLDDQDFGSPSRATDKTRNTPSGRSRSCPMAQSS